MQDVVSIVISLVWLFVIGIIVYYGVWFYGKLTEEEGSGWDMFCEDHFKEAMAHIQNKHPRHSVGYDKAIRDTEFDTDETMEYGYPECTKESKYEVHWIDFTGFRGLKSRPSSLVVENKKVDKRT